MEKDLKKFMEYIEVLNKDVSKYEDEKGNMYIIPNGQLICNCTYNELSKEEYKKAVFTQTIEDGLKYAEETVTRPSSKYERTKKEADMYVIEDKKVAVKKVWVVMNGLKASNSFVTKDEALSFAKEINDRILKNAEII